MAITTKLELRQSQQLVMTPQLQQAIKLLQLSNIELNSFVENELERNPLLEREDDGEPAAASADDDSYDDDGGGGDSGGDDEPVGMSLRLEDADPIPARDLDADADVVYPDAGPQDLGPQLSDNWANVRQTSNNFQDDDPDLEAYVANVTSLKDHLTLQLQMAVTDPVDRLVGSYLIDQVDEAGYLRADLAEVADRLGIDLHRVEALLAQLHTFDPPGVLARDLRECLAIQLKERGRLDPMMSAFLDNLHLVAAHNLPALRRAVGADAEDLAGMLTEIKQLNPRPGSTFGTSNVQTVVPDVLVRAASDGSWIVELNSDTLPRVLINRSYYSRVAGNSRTERDKEFLNDCLQNANWLVKSLDQRARTILRVAEEIVRQQDAFLMYGVQHLRPLNLKTVADAIKMHESTVSRVTSNKYMATSRGIFELKYFFTSSIASSMNGEAYSSESVRHRIKSLIDAEKAEAVLSDDQLVDILQKEGIDIARRTVAKYRESMRIASSVQRRREKRLHEHARMA